MDYEDYLKQKYSTAKLIDATLTSKKKQYLRQQLNSIGKMA
jgi:hypothetical protein